MYIDFRRQFVTLLRRIKILPIFAELIASMLGHVQPPAGIETHAFAVADARGVPPGGGLTAS
jgi:hypothetical protein